MTPRSRRPHAATPAPDTDPPSAAPDANAPNPTVPNPTVPSARPRRAGPAAEPPGRPETRSPRASGPRTSGDGASGDGAGGDGAPPPGPEAAAKLGAALQSALRDLAAEGAQDPYAVSRAAGRMQSAVAAAVGPEAAASMGALPQEAVRAAEALRRARPRDLARLLRAVADLTEKPDAAGRSLEDLSAWFREAFGPILGDAAPGAGGPDLRAEARDAARKAIAASLQARGIAPAGDRPAPAAGAGAPPAEAAAAPRPQAPLPSAPEPAASGPAASGPADPGPAASGPTASMTRHHLFWRNFAALAPALAGLAARPSGAEAATAQVRALLAALDLPDRATVSPGPRLDFAPPADLAEAETLRRILADAPALPGWTLSVGGAAA